MITALAAGCVDKFDKFDNTNVNGATQDTSATTVSACQTSCLAKSDCTGFDFAAGSQCWIHTGSVATGNRRSTSGVDLYVRVKCTGDVSLLLLMISTVRNSECARFKSSAA